jgi:hypothetical protein
MQHARNDRASGCCPNLVRHRSGLTKKVQSFTPISVFVHQIHYRPTFSGRFLMA